MLSTLILLYVLSVSGSEISISVTFTIKLKQLGLMFSREVLVRHPVLPPKVCKNVNAHLDLKFHIF